MRGFTDFSKSLLNVASITAVMVATFVVGGFFVAPAEAAAPTTLIPAATAAVANIPDDSTDANLTDDQLKTLDSDKDGLSDYLELHRYHTNPYSQDTNSNGKDEVWELRNGYSPRHPGMTKLVDVDSDSDGMNDGWELAYGTDLLNPDSDSDGHRDGDEVYNGYDPLDDGAEAKREKIIRVDSTRNHLTFYLGSHVLESFAISAGKAKTPTPLGEFNILQKLSVARYKGPTWDYPNTKWNMLFTRSSKWGYYIHGAYWHSKWGNPVSGGCVNVRYDRMERLYNWADVGTKVIIAKGSE